jgi:hypothetical protein
MKKKKRNIPSITDRAFKSRFVTCIVKQMLRRTEIGIVRIEDKPFMHKIGHFTLKFVSFILNSGQHLNHFLRNDRWCWSFHKSVCNVKIDKIWMDLEALDLCNWPSQQKQKIIILVKSHISKQFEVKTHKMFSFSFSLGMYCWQPHSTRISKIQVWWFRVKRGWGLWGSWCLGWVFKLIFKRVGKSFNGSDNLCKMLKGKSRELQMYRKCYNKLGSVVCALSLSS